MFDNSFLNRVFYKLACALLLPLCMVWGLAKQLSPSPAGGGQGWGHPAAPDMELPQQWQGQPLRPLALSDVEQRFARRFPGTLARLTDGEQVLVLRAVHQPTRMLHPAMDCYRGLGYSIAAQKLQLDAKQQLWRCFEAARESQRLAVCERIVDAQGAVFTDTSAWYWSALMGQSQGPWQAFTVARPL
jgi:hypothetical protein